MLVDMTDVMIEAIMPTTTGSPCLPDHFSGASGRRSITYLPRATFIIGTPGILLQPRSQSHVDTTRT